MHIDIQQFHAAFFEEAVEHLAEMETVLLELEGGSGDAELLNRIFRAAHSIKGASGTFGFTDVARFTHGLESLLDRLRTGGLAVSPGLVERLLRAKDMLATLLADAREGRPGSAGADEMLAELERFAGGAPRKSALPASAAAAPAELREYEVSIVPATDLLRQRSEPLLLLRELATLGEVLETRIDTSHVPDLKALEPDACYVAWTVRLKTERSAEEIKDVFVFVSDDCTVVVEPAVSGVPVASADGDDRSFAAGPAAAKGPAPSAAASASSLEPAGAGGARQRAAQAEASSIRVSVSKVDDLINVVGELVIAQSMLNQAAAHLQEKRQPLLDEALVTLERSVRDLQERVMAIRMVPIGTVFRRFPRLVRDLAANLGKQVAVEILGEETELDKQMVEQIGDPLTHLVRNALDHGIEPPGERTSAGKPEEGRVRLLAYHEGGNVVIDVVDDGQGLDTERIRRKAVALGHAGENDSLTDEQIQAFIFLPGFSTASTVTDVSGRGVGMDVVKKNIEALNGSVLIASERGRGTRFRIRLPLTMAILDGLSVRVGGEVFILPLLSVIESFRPSANDVQTVLGRGEVVVVRGENVPLFRLSQLFNLPEGTADASQRLIVVLETQNQKFGLLVDELIGQIQVVMKSLETNFRKVEGLSGATILGDGRVALVVDVPGLVRRGTSATRLPQASAAIPKERVV